MVIFKTYKVKLYPNKEQEQFFAKSFGCARFVYNYLLSLKTKLHKEEGKSCGFSMMCKEIVSLKKKDEYYWLNDVGSRVPSYAAMDLQRSFEMFFAKKARYPGFRSKKSFNSFTTDRISVSGRKLKIPKLKSGIKFRGYSLTSGTPIYATITMDRCGEYYAAIVFMVESTVSRKNNEAIGIDLGLKNFIVTSDFIKVDANSFLKDGLKRLSKLQRGLSRKTIGSKSWNRQRRKVAIAYKNICNRRNDKLHKLSTSLVRKYGTICTEDLSVRGLIKNRKLSRFIADAGWGDFERMLEYKADWNGSTVVKVGRYFPSSKTCGVCGAIYKDLKLSDRVWKCPECGTTLDRDENAANNILSEGIRILSAGNSDTTPAERM